MIRLPFHRSIQIGAASLIGSLRSRTKFLLIRSCLPTAILLLAASQQLALSQDDPLNKVHVPVPSAAATPATGAPVGAEAAPLTGDAALKMAPGARIAMNV